MICLAPSAIAGGFCIIGIVFPACYNMDGVRGNVAGAASVLFSPTRNALSSD